MNNIAWAANSMDDPAQAQTILRDALMVADSIQEDSFKSDTLSDISIAAGSIRDQAKAQLLLHDALIAADAIQSEAYKSDALNAIIRVGTSLINASLIQDFLSNALRIMHRDKLSAPMVVIANYYAKQANWFKALHALSRAEKREKIVGLSQLLTIVAEHKTPNLIAGAIVLPSDSGDVESSGVPGNYTLTVRIQSPDTSCQNRANWWEVITPDGTLIERRIIDTVHRDKQPFSDSLAAIDITADQTVIIRAHFEGIYLSGNDYLVDERLREYNATLGVDNRAGYTDQALKGSIAEGFEVVRISENFAKWLEEEEPLPKPGVCTES